MLPRGDLPELLPEMHERNRFADAFAHVAEGGIGRLNGNNLVLLCHVRTPLAPGHSSRSTGRSLPCAMRPGVVRDSRMRSCAC